MFRFLVRVFGGWRTRYRGWEQGQRVEGIDRAGHDFAYTLAESVDASGRLLDGRAFQNIRELKVILAANPRQLARNLLHQFTVYSTGTPVRFSDRAEIESMLDACAADGYRVRDLMIALVQSQMFLGQPGCQSSLAPALGERGRGKGILSEPTRLEASEET